MQKPQQNVVPLTTPLRKPGAPAANPFSVSSAPLLVPFPRWQKACDRVCAALLGGETRVVVAGPAGTGKTLLLDSVSRVLRTAGWTVVLRIGEAGPPPAQAGSVVLLVDEADHVPRETLQHLLATTPVPLVLAGQDVLQSRVAGATQIPLGPLAREEARDYIALWLALSGQTPANLEAAAMRRTIELSRGVPRLLSSLLGAAAWLAESADEPVITVRQVEEAASLRACFAPDDTDPAATEAPEPASGSRPMLLVAASSMLLLGAAAFVAARYLPAQTNAVVGAVSQVAAQVQSGVRNLIGEPAAEQAATPSPPPPAPLAQATPPAPPPPAANPAQVVEAIQPPPPTPAPTPASQAPVPEAPQPTPMRDAAASAASGNQTADTPVAAAPPPAPPSAPEAQASPPNPPVAAPAPAADAPAATADAPRAAPIEPVPPNPQPVASSAPSTEPASAPPAATQPPQDIADAAPLPSVAPTPVESNPPLPVLPPTRPAPPPPLPAAAVGSAGLAANTTAADPAATMTTSREPAPSEPAASPTVVASIEPTKEAQLPRPTPAEPPAPPPPAPSVVASAAPLEPSHTLAPDVISLLVRRGHDMMAIGDVSAARLLFGRAAESGNVEAMLEMGKTYDPTVLAEASPHFPPNPAAASRWYRRAAEAGNTEAGILLSRLPAPASR